MCFIHPKRKYMEPIDTVHWQNVTIFLFALWTLILNHMLSLMIWVFNWDDFIKKLLLICSSDFIFGSGSLLGSCYKLFTVPERWDNARAKCEDLGAQLVKIESAEENDFLKSTYLNASGVTFWIGLNDQMQEGEWIWADGSSLGDYVNWFQDPNNLGDNQHCVHILRGPFSIGEYHFQDYDSGWNDLECDVTLGYICEAFSP